MVRNKRIDALVEKLKGYHTVLDIGCDHGLVLKYALDKGYIKHAIASDIAKKPLEVAMKNLSQYQVDFILSDGFKSIDKPFDACVIAGLGGITLTEILSFAPKHDFELVLMPHDNLYHVRKFLELNDYGIISEKVIFDKHYYTVFHVKKRKMELSEKQRHTGYHIEFDEIACAYFFHQLKKYQLLLDKATQDRALYFKDIIKYFEEVYHECLAESTKT
jgi:tRNA (adenine22-N1)-methyltransferase